MISASQAAIWIVVALGPRGHCRRYLAGAGSRIGSRRPLSARVLLCQSMAGGWRGAGNRPWRGRAPDSWFFLLFYVLGGMGGGDVKLMAGFGALLGWSRLWQAALWTAILGALLAVIVLAVHARPSQTGGWPVVDPLRPGDHRGRMAGPDTRVRLVRLALLGPRLRSQVEVSGRLLRRE